MSLRDGTIVTRLIREALDAAPWSGVREKLKVFLPSPLAPRVVLNDEGAWAPEATASALGIELRAFRNVLESEAAVRQGRVDYRNLADTEVFQQMAARSRLLHHVSPESFRYDAERIAFWTNLYNALCIHGVIALGLRRSVMEMPSFFSRVAYRVGNWTFTPEDIENGVLRRGARRRGWPRSQFRRNDPRRRFFPSYIDPRIHGALVCLATSCPPVAFYDPERLDEQLDLATGHLISGSVEADSQRRRLHLPLQFYYYASDFGGRAAQRAFICKYLPDDARGIVARALDEGWPVIWKRYDWTLNHADEALGVATVTAEPRA